MTTSTITARRKGDPQHYVEGQKHQAPITWVHQWGANTSVLVGLLEEWPCTGGPNPVRPRFVGVVLRGRLPRSFRELLVY